MTTDLPRDKMILFFAGHFLTRSDTWKDMVIDIDNFLLAQNYTPMTKEERQFMEDVYDQVWLMMKTKGLNRHDIRTMFKKGRKEERDARRSN